MNIIKPDWEIFKAKFSENPQKNFEWLCYLLFCKQFNKPFGIFRYKNQSGLETNPITIDGDVIGWQAKFYDTTLSSHKNDLIDTLEKIKRDYPDITKVFLYTNAEWAQKTSQKGKKQQEPQGKIEIEEKAEELKINIEWNTASFFESSFVTIDNNLIAKHFFSLDKSIINLLNEKEEHNNVILFDIQTDIDFNDYKIEIDRTNALKNIKDKLKDKQILIVSGVGGVGKTAIIKNLYKEIKNNIPFYVFKANEFSVNRISDLFEGFSLKDFIEAHKDEENKIIVIDSAEKLLEIQNADIFKEFLLSLIKNEWKIIFTTRNNYLEDLTYEFIEIHRIVPFNLDIQNLSKSELENLSTKYNFSLPEDLKLLELIENPFYLSEYLKFYNENEALDYPNFKEKLWNKIIKKSKPARERCFLQTAFERANQSQFFVNPDFDHQVLDKLVKDGILGYETAGYFITHDIYEEWALEKIINSKFINKQDNKEFFENIGESLPIRRSFRNWISEKLFLEDDSIKQFIEEIIYDEKIESFWKDEILISILLSDYSEVFFELFNEKLIEDDLNLLKRLTFLLRIACKEVDNDLFKHLRINLDSIGYIFTKPKGKGWKSLIKFVYNNLDAIKIENIKFILPIIHDWNSKFKEGEITKLSGLIALKYYKWIIKEDKYLDKDIEVKLLQTILYSASEIKDELIIIFDEILENKWKNHRDPYNELIRAILTKIGDNLEVIKVLPEYVLKLADLFWFKTPKKDDFHNSKPQGDLPITSRHQGDLPIIDDPLDLDGNFCIERHITDYFPSSAFQTPIYWLLQYSFQETINFILNFTNKTVECYAKSDFGKEEIPAFGKEKVVEIDVLIEDENTTKQYIDDVIWNVYRATKNSSHVLQSIHMALEKFFLERAEHTDSKILENWLLYLLKNTRSASITAVVVSIVLAFPDKTFNVAKVLFQTKEFFIYDTNRMALENQVMGIHSHEYGTLFQNERIETRNDKHRKKSLEHLALEYQILRNEGISEDEVKKRQKVIWSIFDEYYNNLPDKSEENEFDKTWRLYLARMDSRKMTPKAEEKDGQIILSFDTEIDSELKKFSEDSIKEGFEVLKHTNLNLWAKYKIENDDRYKQYEQYNNNPKLALEEVKEIIEGFQKPNNENYFLFNRSIPGNACSILIRDYHEKLSKDEKSYCKDIILEIASISLTINYNYQLGDGVDAAISVLPLLLKEFPEEKENIKDILFLTLLDSTNMGYNREFCNYSKKAILNNLWDISFDDVQSLLSGYLWLKPKYEELRLKLHEQSPERRYGYRIPEFQLVKEFVDKYNTELKKVIDNKMTINDLDEIEKLDLHILKTAFQLIPSDNVREHNELAQTIISTFAEDLLSNKREDRVDYWLRYDFLEKLADFILNSSEQDVSNYLNPFIDKFNNSKSMADLFKRFIIAVDVLNPSDTTYDNFWTVWNLFYEKIVELCKDGDYGHTKEIIKSYLFAETSWKEDATEWHVFKNGFKENYKRFFKKITDDIGCYPSVLYSISKLLNSIGSIYLNDGISWISNMLKNNENLWTVELERNTIYYLEKLVRKYSYENREELRKTTQLKQELLVILDFLIEKESVVGYMLRENIL